MTLRWLIKRLFLRMGLDVRRAEAARTIDPWLAIRSLLEPAKVQTIIDVGAYVGDYTERFLFFFPQAKIYAFEPALSSFQKLERRFLGHPRVHTFPLALADYEGNAQFFLNADPVTNSLLPATDTADMWANTSGAYAQRGSVIVPVTTLDSFCQKQNISTVDILKVDAQGADLMVLKGAERMLRSANIAIILVELTFVSLYETQSDGLSILSYLEQFRYRIFNFFALHHAENGRLKECDALLLQERLLGEERR